jgi:toxin ParE1/3/4
VSPSVTARPRSRLDLPEQFVYFGEQAGVAVAERYFAAVDATCIGMADHPQCGVLHDTGIARLKGLRRFPVKDFERYLLFYLHGDKAIDAVRVLHACRDINDVFAQEEA